MQDNNTFITFVICPGLCDDIVCAAAADKEQGKAKERKEGVKPALLTENVSRFDQNYRRGPDHQEGLDSILFPSS